MSATEAARVVAFLGIWREAFNDGAGRFALRTGAWAPGLGVHPTDFDATLTDMDTGTAL